jgi:hypothetical protein
VGGGTTTATNSTITQNVGTDGAGVCKALGSIALTNVTIARNSSRANNGLQIVSGGGFWTDSARKDTVTNTLITGNTEKNVGYPLESSNLYGGLAGSLFGFSRFPGRGNLVSDDANAFLGPLAYNGGYTPTMALLSGSPAIGTGVSAGTFPGIPLVDQRGWTRTGPMDVGVFQYGSRYSAP